MLVLHGLCTTDGVLALWAEDSGLPARSESARRDAPHPFAASAESLAAALGLEPFKTTTRTLLLPSFSSGPMASPELVRDPLTAGRAPRGKVQLRQWGVPTIRLDGIPELGAETRLSASARFVFDVAGFAADLVGRGRVLPSIAPERAVARWVPVLSGTDSARFAALQAAMPPACRCEEIASDPAELVRAALTTAVDEQVRSRLNGMALAPARRGSATTAESWLDALTGEPAFDADPVELYELREHLDRWRDSAGNESPVRTCFRLRSPEQRDDEEWAVEFLLQAVDEPSVLVPAQQVWFADDGVLRRWIPAPQEHLLADLGRASKLHPDLDEALRGSHPAEMEVDAEGAYRFLTAAPVLAQAGFGVLLPSWWQQTTKLGLKLTTKSRGTAGTVAKESEIGLKSIVDYKWELALGEETLTDAELAELARAKVSLVKVRGQWVQVDQKRLAAGLAFLKRGGGQMTAAEVMLHSGLTEEDESLPLPLMSVEADGWLGDLLSGKADEQLEPVEPPANFLAQLRPYQQRGLAWLAFLDKIGLGACLADDMGLGKTVQLLALEALNRSHGKRPPTLLVCPMSVVGNWQREAARFTPELSVHVHHGADRLDGDALREAVESHDLILTTYALAARDADALGELTFDRVVLDEAQNIKNSATRQSQAVRQLKARHRVALTGTPVENRLAELWSIMDFANPGVLGTVNTFRARFAVPVERHNDQDAAARLRKITNPFVLRRVKTDPRIISDLPDKVEMRQLCNLTTEQASLYQAVVNDMLERIEEAEEGIGRKGLVLATMSKLKQVCNHPAHFLGDGSRVAGRSGKLARLEEVLEEVLAEGDKALCFTQFTEFGSMLVPYLAARFDTEVMFLHGGTNKASRDRMVERFQDRKGPSLFLLSLKAGGTGLNLTAANHVIHLDRWWNPAVEDQATDRAFRIGQRRNVQVRKFVCIGTLEERIDTMIEEKRALAQLVVGAGENWLTDLSTAQLRDLLTLSGKPSVSEHWSGERSRYGKTIKVDNGLKAQSKRGDIGATWWSRRFIEVLESFGMGGRLTRGRNYARQGQVLSLSLSTSMVIALVQGSRPTPYKTRIAIKSFTGQEWQRIEHALAGKALYAAKLLAGEMPADIETLFASLGLQLFPATQRELTMDCSCPDWEVPCKHLAATCYLLAESFDNDPFGILAWRGRGREDLLDRLRALRGTVRSAVAREEAPPLTRCLDTFWQRQTTSNLHFGDPTAVVRTDAVLDQLDGVPITVGHSSLADLLRPAYLSLKPAD